MSGLDYQRARRFIAAVPEGRWTTFKSVAKVAGNPAAALPIGVWLKDEGDTVDNPWRVLLADGSVPPHYHSSVPGRPRSAAEVRVVLKDEGVRFSLSHKADPYQHFDVKHWNPSASASSGSRSGVAGTSARSPAGVQLGATVRALDLMSEMERTWTLVHPSEVNAAAGRVSAKSPIGRALIGRYVGDVVSVLAPAGERRYRILGADPYIAPATPIAATVSAPTSPVQSPAAAASIQRARIDGSSEMLARAASQSPAWLPDRIAHADWGSAAAKCVVGTADLHDGIYHAHPPRTVLDGHRLIERMRLAPEEGHSTLLGFDFPLGVPRAYARLAGITNFAHWLRQLDLDSQFFRVASDIDEVSVQRPFFPQLITTKSPGIQAQFHQALGLTATQMLRRCDRPHCGHGGASSMFWALGPKAVAKMTLAGWSTTIRPALAEPGRVYTIWPFDGPMRELLESSDAVIVETYPRDAYLQLGLRMGAIGTAKTKQTDRAAEAPLLLEWCVANAVRPDEELIDQIVDGFGAAKDGEDRFDAVAGLFGMIATMRRAAEPELPDDPQVRLVEGWMFGRHAICPG